MTTRATLDLDIAACEREQTRDLSSGLGSQGDADEVEKTSGLVFHMILIQVSNAVAG